MKRILLILTCLFLLTGCNSKDNSNNEKISSEIEYISTQIANLLNNLNNISLENYELVSEKVSISQSSSSSGSQGGESQPSSGGQGQGSQSSSGGGGSQGGEQGASQGSQQGSAQGGEQQSISVTEMQNKSVLKTDTENVDWDLMRQQIENINTSWGIVMLDLNNANVPNTDIIDFSNILDDTIIAINNEDKNVTLTNLTNLYSYIPKFLTATSSEKHLQNIETTKYYIFTAYSAATQNDWNAVTTSLSNAESNFLSVLNDTEYSKNKEYKINKTYILIKDMQNSVQNNDKSLFFLKYKNLIESLNTL